MDKPLYLLSGHGRKDYPDPIKLYEGEYLAPFDAAFAEMTNDEIIACCKCSEPWEIELSFYTPPGFTFVGAFQELPVGWKLERVR